MSNKAERILNRFTQEERIRSGGYVYFISGAGLVKIGTMRDYNLEQRLKTLQACSPVSLSVLCVIEGGSDCERAIHKEFSHLRMHGEWFRNDAKLREFIAAMPPLKFDDGEITFDGVGNYTLNTDKLPQEAPNDR